MMMRGMMMERISIDTMMKAKDMKVVAAAAARVVAAAAETGTTRNK
jgi:hypothetical protein